MKIIEIVPMGKSPIHEAMETLAYMEWLKKQICISFGIPKKYFENDSSTYTNSKENEKWYLSNLSNSGH